jgi:putative transposase
VKANQADANHRVGVRTMCQTLGVSTSGYYAWRDRRPSAQAQGDRVLTQKIREVHSASDGTYGMPRIRKQLRAEGVRVSRKRVARLMKASCLRGVTRRRFHATTVRDERQRPAPDLVNRNFQARAPDQLWVADITFVPTAAGFLYLAVVLDAFSRKVVGWSMAEEMPTDLVLSALNMALQVRRPKQVIHHSDQGCQYTSMAFRRRCEQAGVRLSMGSVGDAYDNAMAESFFATLECELIARRSWKTRAEARTALFQWIEGWYNPRRLHSSVDYLSPNAFERKYVQENRPSQKHGFPTAAVGSSQAPPAAVENPAPLLI